MGVPTPGWENNKMIIRKAEEKDIPALTEMMAWAFADETFNRWLYKDEQTAVRRGQKMFDLMARRFIGDGYLMTTDDLKSAILCVPPSCTDSSFVHDMGFLLRMALIMRTKTFFMLNMFRQMEIMKPKEPHLYVEVLGVHPSVQRQGRGRILLDHVLRICDERGWPAYLENPEYLVPYYESFGFKVRDTYDVPKVGITMYTMSRLPKQQ